MTIIYSLPDEVLLKIFDFCVVANRYYFPNADGQSPIVTLGQDMQRQSKSWHSLVHVCRLWRVIVFGSARRLNLELFLTTGSSARKTLDAWPTLPLLLNSNISAASVDNVIAVLENSSRIRQFNLTCLPMSQIENEKDWAAMQVPFPELTVLT